MKNKATKLTTCNYLDAKAITRCQQILVSNRKNGILKTIGIKVEYTTNWKLRQRFQRNSADFSSKPSYLSSSQLRTALCPYNASYLGLALIENIRMKIFVSPAQLAHSVSSAGPEKQSSRLTTIKGFFR